MLRVVGEPPPLSLGLGGDEDPGQRQGGGHDGEHPRVRPRYGYRNLLGAVLEATDEEARPEHEQDVPDYGADDRGLHHRREARGEGKDGDDDLRGVAEGGVQDAADARAGVVAQCFGRLPSTQTSPTRAREVRAKITSTGAWMISTTTATANSAVVP